MTRQAAVSVENNFSKGLITEATGLNFPENACTETYNCVFDKTGEVSRRLGIQIEDGLEQNAIDALTDSALTEFLWKSVSLTGERTFFVIQRGSIISFWAVDQDGLIAPNLHEFYYNLNDNKVAGSPNVQDVHASFAAGNGLLYIAHPYCTPVRIEYDVEEDTFTADRLDLKVRDMTGVTNSLDNDSDPYSGDPIPSDNRPTTLSGKVLYNLLNQGWDQEPTFRLNRHVFGANTPLLKVWRKGVFNFPNNAGGAFDVWQAKNALGRNDWPSEADFWTAYKRPIIPILDEDGNPTSPNVPDEGFALDATDDKDLGNSPAPKGHFLYDAFNLNRWATITHPGQPTAAHFPEAFVGLTPLEDESSGYARPSQIAFYAGRVWYAGVDANRYNTRIYFSWVVENNLHSEKCYQRNDPTASDAPSPDLLSSDGGVVVIPDIARIIKLVPYGNSLLVFASNGIWQIAGSAAGAGFTANDYGVVKIASVGAISFLNFVDADGTPLWWNSDGIYTMRQAENGQLQAASLTNTTIQTFYDEIPVASRRFTKGIFNLATKTVQWVYRSSAPTNTQERYHYDRILNLDLNTGSFYPWTISDSCLYVAGITVLNGYGGAVSQVAVTDDDVIVTDGGETVTISETVLADITPRFKYVVHNECDDVDPGDEEVTGNSLTYNRAFYGTLNNTDFGGGGNGDATMGGVLVGEDGKLYIPNEYNNALDQQALIQYNSDGTAVKIDYPIASIAADLANAGLSGTAGINSNKRILPVPFTKYFFYQCASNGPGLGSYVGYFGLYKINSLGAIEFTGKGKAYTGHFGVVGYSNIMDFCAVSLEDFSVDPLDSDILVAFNSAVFSGTYAGILRVPSVNTFMTSSGTTEVWSTALATGFTDNYYVFGTASTYSPEADTAACFFLPGPGGIVTHVYRYVDYATARAHVDNVASGFSVTSIDTLAASAPSGFVMRSPITGASWSNVTSAFNDIPDGGLNRDGTAGDPILNDWTQPFHQYDSATDKHYISWVRKYAGTEVNQTSIGTFAKVKIEVWNPESERATALVEEDAEASGGPFDAVSDLNGTLVGGLPYGSYPRHTFAFMSPDLSEAFIFAHFDSTSSVSGPDYALAKFGDIVFAEEAEVPQTQLAFAEFTNSDFLDWPDITIGVDYDSYFISGYKLRGEAIRKFQSNYFQVYTRNTDPSTFDIYGRWDYATSGNTGRWNSVQRVTMDDTRYDYRTKRLKMRGHGKALQFKVNSVSGEPFNLIGWSIYETTNATP